MDNQQSSLEDYPDEAFTEDTHDAFEAAELMEPGSIRHLQQVSSGALEKSSDPSSNQNTQGNNPNKISISSPYIHLSSCYAGKVCRTSSTS